MRRQKASKKNRQSGFTLLELSISLLIIGVVFGGGLLSVSQYIKAEKVQATKVKIDLIENALSAYVQTHYRLPCPADPGAAAAQIGWEGPPATPGKCFVNNTNPNLYWNTEGIVPWKELGLPQDMVVDAWNHYITYKPAPQLTVDNMDASEQDSTNVASADVHNACRTSMWYNNTNTYLNRAKGLFCCNAAPKAAYQASNGIAPLTAHTDWLQNGVVDTSTANTPAVVGNGTSLKSGAPVAMTGNWMDSTTDATTITDEQGTFTGFNASKPEPPLLRATGLAVTLISHGGGGDLAFLPEQSKQNLLGGSVDPVAGNVTSTAPPVKQENVWPPNLFAGVFGHPKVADGTFDPLGGLTNASDNIVSYLRSDNLFARVGQASCAPPPAPPPITCHVPTLSWSGSTIKMAIPYNTIALTMQSSVERLTDDTSRKQSIGYYNMAPDGTIQSVSMLETDMQSMPSCSGPDCTHSPNVNTPLQAGSSEIGVYILSNGDQIAPDGSYTKDGGNNNFPMGPNQYANVDLNDMKMVNNFNAANQTYDVANATSAGTNPSIIARSTVADSNGDYPYVELHGANNDANYGIGNAYWGGSIPDNNGDNGGSGVIFMNSNLNYGNISHVTRGDDKNYYSPSSGKPNPTTIGPTTGSNGQTELGISFEDMSTVNGYYDKTTPNHPSTCSQSHNPGSITQSNNCIGGNPPLATNLRNTDQFGGYLANLGDNDYNDIDVNMSISVCGQQD